jgi:FkbM family methyltransferase
MSLTGIPVAVTTAFASAPLVLCDVGARGGPPARWQPLFEHLTWIAFEPDARSRDALDPALLPRRRVILPTALWNRRERIPLHLTRDEGDSSVLRPNSGFVRHFVRPERFDIVGTSEMEASTLDEELASHGTTVDFLKLDTQGSELQILEGATHTIRAGVLGVEVEVEFSRIYEGQPLFADVDRLLRGFDLELVDLSPKRWPYAAGSSLSLARGQVVWGDALYLPSVDAFRGVLQGCGTPGERLIRTAKMVAIGLIHGVPDYSAAILETCAPLLPPDAGESMQEAVAQWDASGPATAVPFQLDLKPDDIRALHRIAARQRLKPTAQVRRAIRAWIKGQEG